MDSPSPLVKSKNRPRRSLSLRSTTTKKRTFQADTHVDSPDLSFGTSPNLSFSASDSRLNLECSTPVNHNRKRSFFTEDGAGGASSPCVDVSASAFDVSGMNYQASPSLPFAMSQEMRRVGVDVVWQWNSPKRNFNLDRRTDENIPMARKRRKSFTTSSTTSGTGSEVPATGGHGGGVETAKGFYKIREELLKAKKETESGGGGHFMRLLQEDEDDEKRTHSNLACDRAPEKKESQKQKDPDATLTRKLSDELLNDSDDDEHLLIISQETEKKVAQESEAQICREEFEKIGGEKKALRTPTTKLQSRERELNFSNDSFDQYLLDIPFDELLNRNAEKEVDKTVLVVDNGVQKKKEEQQPRSNSSGGSTIGSGSSNGIGGGKGTLNRTLSMPSDTEQLMILEKTISSGGSGSSSSRSMARHESMPIRTKVGGGGGGGIRGGKVEAGRNSGCASKFSVSNPTLTTMAMSSSTESLYSTTSSSEKAKICSQVEIARKRQIAQERLKQKQQQLSQIRNKK